MLRSEGSASQPKLPRAAAAVFCFVAALLVLPASAQDFSLTANPFNPDAFAPGGTSSSNISIVTNPGFVGPVTLSCTVTAPVQIPPANLPQCQVSPPSLAASGGAAATITSTGTTSTIGYTATITGTDASGTQSSPPLTFTVLSVTPQFTITIQSPVTPSTVVAGSGAEGVVTVNPADGYTTPTPNGYITLYCSSIAPLVTIAPVCSFSYPNQKGITISGNTPQSSTLTINTFGPVTTGANARPKSLYALWLAAPILGLVLLGGAASSKRSKKAWIVLGLFVVGGSLFLLPACSNNNNTTTTTPNGITPANTYTFTIVGVDTNGVVSSNTGSTTSAGPTVSLTVTAPPKQ